MTCRLCDGRIVLGVKLNPQPKAETYTQDKVDNPLYPVDLYICLDCGHVQQKDAIEGLWENYTYRSEGPMGKHFDDVSEWLSTSYDLQGLAVDIGSNDGAFLKRFKNKGMRVLGFDPAVEIAAEATRDGITTIPKPFTASLVDGKASLVTAFNVFAHTNDLRGMVEGVKAVLQPGGLFVFEAQYWMDVVNKMLIGTIFHEHMSHHAITPLVRFLKTCGLELIDVERNEVQGGSIIGICTHSGEMSPKVEKLVQTEKDRGILEPYIMKEFSMRLESLKSRNWGTISGFGAARSASTFIRQLNLDVDVIFDDHPQKVGKFQADGVQVIPTKELYSRLPKKCGIFAWVHEKNIRDKFHEYERRGGKFLRMN